MSATAAVGPYARASRSAWCSVRLTVKALSVLLSETCGRAQSVDDHDEYDPKLDQECGKSELKLAPDQSYDGESASWSGPEAES